MRLILAGRTRSNDPFIIPHSPRLWYSLAMDLERRLVDHVVVLDGAMGSELLARVPEIPSIDLAALTHPAEVLAIHLEYLQAGAEILQTATFAASRPRLETLRAGDRTEAVNSAAIKLAREAREVAGADCLVAGSLGPLAALLDPDDPRAHAELMEAHAEQAAILAGRGADLLVLESFFRLDELELALDAVASATSLPVIALMTFPAGRPPHPWGNMAAQVARLAEREVAAVGLSCAPGPMGTLEILERIPPLARPLAVEPNAGVVVHRPDRELLSPATPAYLGRFALRAVELGAAMVGSCCGTGPEHTRAIAAAVAGLAPPAARKPSVSVMAAPEERPATPPPRQPRSSLAEALVSGRFVRVVQIDPPRGANSSHLVEAVRTIATTAAIDAVDINSNPLGRLRMDSLWLAAEIERETGVATIPHVTPRDAGIMGLEAQLLGAWRAGIRNLLAITGDPSTLGDYPGHMDVNHVDIFELVRTIRRMAAGEDWSGNPIGDPPAFFTGVAVNPHAADLAHEADRLRRKIEAGASFIMSQVFFEWAPWERLLELFGGGLPVPALVAVWPLTSLKLALRLHYEVPGILVPEELLRRLEDAGPQAGRVGTEHARRLLAEAPSFAQGAYLIAPFKRPERILDLLEGLSRCAEPG
ncbi:MAG TPA: bifunctional homocysteine S-methyltransferase/methylenetetrahydrofolate reductase [Acidobacteria bacterium]|nr:bifunctional homocysteine S-methyltransferase/methylenetetrahydrofolate reductase [Acidobacteriota bacterium]